ncbi:low-density lipoprotein receptor-related protein 4-like [Bolinopsis microptera]|uniref:low-density lipoprotein receptor-related protein 4-like n=1 Tax=Bolinopsis microptera TaxID=2820187 RepID=UPI003079DFE3
MMMIKGAMLIWIVLLVLPESLLAVEEVVAVEETVVAVEGEVVEGEVVKEKMDATEFTHHGTYNYTYTLPAKTEAKTDAPDGGKIIDEKKGSEGPTKVVTWDYTEELEPITEKTIVITCPDSHIKCGDGLCVSKRLQCDGTKDCSDGSDEIPEFCLGYTCPGNDIKCGDGLQCIDPWQNCNDKVDCLDGSDESEEICSVSSCEDQESEILCGDGQQCILNLKLCDGKAQCEDGSDESDEFCWVWDGPCHKGSLKCADGRQCITASGMCDGVRHCKDGSDEIPEFCQSFTCPGYQTKCGDGTKCNANWRLCDGKSDCDDGSDEEPGFCAGYECLDKKEKCDDGLQCIASNRVCDDKAQCHDKSDESAEKCGDPDGEVVVEVKVTKKKRKGKGKGKKVIRTGKDKPDEEGDKEGGGKRRYRGLGRIRKKKIGPNNEIITESATITTSFITVVSTEGPKVTEPYPTCDCWTPECGYCSNMDCTVKQDLINSQSGVEVHSHIKRKTFSTIVLYEEDGKVVGRLQWSLSGIYLTGCIACQTPPALKKATAKGGHTVWSLSLKNGFLRIKIDGEVLYKQDLRGECADIYGKIKRFAFSDMSCENSFSFDPAEMELGEGITSDCGGKCSR